MAGSDKGMKYCTVREAHRFEPYGALFPGGKDPVAAGFQE